MKKKILLLCIMAIGISLCGCGKPSKEENDAATESYSEENEYNSASVIVSEESEKAFLQKDGISVSIGNIEGYSRSFGNDSFIEYMDNNGSGNTIDYQIYDGYSISAVEKIVLDYAASEEYSNELLNQSTDTYTAKDGIKYELIMVEYKNEDRTIYNYVYLTEIAKGQVLSISLNSNESLDNSSFVLDSVKITQNKSSEDSSEENN